MKYEGGGHFWQFRSGSTTDLPANDPKIHYTAVLNRDIMRTPWSQPAPILYCSRDWHGRAAGRAVPFDRQTNNTTLLNLLTK